MIENSSRDVKGQAPILYIDGSVLKIKAACCLRVDVELYRFTSVFIIRASTHQPLHNKPAAAERQSYFNGKSMAWVPTFDDW